MYPEADVLILDGAAIVHMIRPGAAKTFQVYAEDVFLPQITHMLQTVSRLDVVWDVYRTNSLKSIAREERGKGKRRRATPTSSIPSNCHTFLRVDDNKTELFKYLAQCLIKLTTDKTIITTQGTIAVSNAPVELDGLSPCTHEEADSRMMVHLSDAAKENKHILLRSTDTDVVVLAVASASLHPEHEVWVAMGVGNTSGTFLLTLLPGTLVPPDHPAFLFSTVLLVATLCLFSMASARRKLGKCGMCLMM